MIIFYSIPVIFIAILVLGVLGVGLEALAWLTAWISQYHIVIGIILIVLKLLLLLLCIHEGNKSNDKNERFSGDDTFFAFLCEIITSVILMAALIRFAHVMDGDGLGEWLGGFLAIILNVVANFFGLSLTVNKVGWASIGISIGAYLLCVFW